jgi:hypothetical protein
MLVIRSDGFLPGTSGNRVLQTGPPRFQGEKQRESNFDWGGTTLKCPSRLGGLEITGSRVDGIPVEILQVFFLVHLGLAVGGVSRDIGWAELSLESDGGFFEERLQLLAVCAIRLNGQTDRVILTVRITIRTQSVAIPQ